VDESETNMNRHSRQVYLVVLFRWWSILLLLIACNVGVPGFGQENLASQRADAICSLGSSGGMIAIIGDQHADLAISLAKRGPFTVQCLTPSDAARDQLRQSIDASGLYGSVSAITWTDPILPYMDNSINLLIVVDLGQSASMESTVQEVMRVLTPLGQAFVIPQAISKQEPNKDEIQPQAESLGLVATNVDVAGNQWLQLKKNWPENIDQWTHFLHGADGNPVARDLLVGPPRHYQWTSGPSWLRSHETDSSISTMVTAQGRLFYIMDQAPISLTGQHSLPDKWALVARDAFNGVVLWEIPIRRWGWREWKNTWFINRPGDFPLNIRKRLVADGDDVYVTLGYRAPVSRIDARSGEIRQSYAQTEGAGELLYVDGRLVVAKITDGAVKILAVDADSGEVVWESGATYRGTTVDYLRWPTKGIAPPPSQIDPALNLASDGKVVALVDGPEIVCLDAANGQEAWRARFPSVPEDEQAGGIKSRGDLWVGTMIVSNGVVLHASPYQLAAFSQNTGEVMWSQPKRYIGHLWYEWKDVFVIDRLVWTWSAELEQGVIQVGQGKRQRQQWPRTVNGYDIQTGELRKQVELGNIFRTHHHHRCYRNKATLRYILASRRGTEFVDLQDGHHTVDNWVRGTCHVGMMPANGLQYVPPHPCRCYLDEKLIGFNVLASAVQQPAPTLANDQRLHVGPANANPDVDGQVAQPEIDWPAFRHDALRTGAIASSLPSDHAQLWHAALGGRLSAPIAVGDQVFLASVDQHRIVALSAKDGSVQWRFTAGSRIDSPPTYYRGAVLFGSADGCVYSVDASSGELVWKFTAAPTHRLIGVDGQLESAWPVHGSVLVQNDVVYFAAGRSSQLDGGITLYGLNVDSGQMLHSRTLVGPRYTVDNVEENYNLPMGALPDILIGDGTNIFMRTQAYDRELKPCQEKADLQPAGGFLDDSYFKRTPWRFRDDEYARLIVHDNRRVYYVRMFDSLRGLDPTVFFTPGQRGYLLFAKDLNGQRDAWRLRIPVRIRAMALTGNQLVVAGPPDVVDRDDPLGAFEGRLGGRLYVLGNGSGESQKQHVLEAAPVFNGIAIARGRLVIVDERGNVSCFGQP
jgi:outer membrane protein assembly factor BamB